MHSKNSYVYADQRLVSDITPINTASALSSLLDLSVVSHRPSDSHCKHQNLTASECENSRSVGLLAQDVKEKLGAHAVGSGGHLTLLGTDEKVENLQSLSLHAMLANLVAAVQAQAGEIDKLKAEIKELKEA